MHVTLILTVNNYFYCKINYTILLNFLLSYLLMELVFSYHFLICHSILSLKKNIINLGILETQFYVLLSKESGTNAGGSLWKDPAEAPGLNKRARAVKTTHSTAKKVKRERRESSGRTSFFLSNM